MSIQIWVLLIIFKGPLTTREPTNVDVYAAYPSEGLCEEWRAALAGGHRSETRDYVCEPHELVTVAPPPAQ